MRIFQAADGILTLEGTTIPLKYAYAFELADDEVNPPRKRLRLLLSQYEVPLKARAGAMGRYALHQEKKLVGIEFELHSPRPEENATGIVFPPPPGALSTFTVTGKKHFTELTIAEGVLSGKVVSDKSAPVRYQASFRCRISLLPPLVKILTGMEAQTHPFVALVSRYFAAAQQVDSPAMRALVSQETLASWARQEKRVGTAAYQQELREVAALLQFDPRTVTRVVVRAERATVVAALKDGTQELIELYREGLVWKVHVP